MKGLKSDPKMRRPHTTENRINSVKHMAALALALIVIVSELWLPAYCRSEQASVQLTIDLAPKGSWTFTGNLNVPRVGHTATLLPNGKVLVAGGYGIGGFRNTAELYDPASKTWRRVGNLNTSRTDHTATLLSNGKVLVAGGYNAVSSALNSAELYDPEADTFSLTGNLNTARFGHTATLLQNGRLLVVGGDDGSFDGDGASIPLDSAEVYDADTGGWTFTGNVARDNHTATLLQSGKVLVVGGGDPTELYNPVTGAWSSAGNINGGVFRSGHTATLLPNGKVLVVGGAGDGDIFNTAESYDPENGTWSNTGNLNTARFDHTATLLPSGTVLVAGGDDTRSDLASSELYDPDLGKSSFTSNLNTARRGHTATLLPDGKVLVVGGGHFGFAGGSILNTAELYDPDAIAIPRIISAFVSGKKLFVSGENFDPGAVILLNGEEQITKNDGQNPQTALVGKKAGKKTKQGDKLQVRNSNGTMSEEFTFTGS